MLLEINNTMIFKNKGQLFLEVDALKNKSLGIADELIIPTPLEWSLLTAEWAEKPETLPYRSHFVDTTQCQSS